MRDDDAVPDRGFILEALILARISQNPFFRSFPLVVSENQILPELHKGLGKWLL